MNAVREPSTPLAFPVLSRFEDIADPSVYVPIPQDWAIGVADVVNSTGAIAAGRYKTVNMAGAAVIAAVSNVLGQIHFPFIFGGDGSAFAVPPEHVPAARQALATTATFVAEEFDLELRVAVVPVASIRSAGFDIRIAEFAVSADVRYAMFSGGGLAWAEDEMKAGRFQLPKAPPGSRPDLTGLTCRFEPVPARRGLVLSIIVRPILASDAAAYSALVREILGLIEASPDMAQPIPDGGPPLGWPPSGHELEARIVRRPGASLWPSRLSVLVRTALSTLVFRLGLRVGGFEPGRYIKQLVANSDYRKYDDGLRVTLDCTPDLADRLETILQNAEREGVARHGLHRQSAALMTCITPSVLRSDHIHFVDGASGGYAAAASAMKR